MKYNLEKKQQMKCNEIMWNLLKFLKTWIFIIKHDVILMKHDWFVILTVEQPQSRKVGSISDYDPLNEKYGSIAGQHTDPRRGNSTKQKIVLIYLNHHHFNE
jgi:hypothetical protein